MMLLIALLLCLAGLGQSVIQLDVRPGGYNASIPGPRIDVQEGQWIEVRVTNYLMEPTSVHWHGQFQIGTPDMDGVPGLSQCGILPGESLVMRFQANPSGTFWYHSHSGTQYMDGFYGAFVVHTMRDIYTAQIDQEFLLVDWYNQPSSVIMAQYNRPIADGGGDTPQPNAIMVNGHLGGLTMNVSHKAKAKYRFINAGARSMWNVSASGTIMVITEIDGTLTEAMYVKDFVINVAQRVTVIIDLTPTLVVSVLAITSMYSDDGYVGFNTRFDITHVGGVGYPLVGQIPTQDLLDARPLYPIPVPAANITLKWHAEFTLNSAKQYVPIVNGLNFANMEDAETPMLYSGNFTGGLIQYVPMGSVIEMLLIVEETSEHPIHLHGNRFWIMETSTWNRTGGVQRDTVSVPIEGWARIRFVANRGTAYMIHCHILSHSVNGFSSLIVETPYLGLGAKRCHYNSTTVSSAFRPGLGWAILLNLLVLIM